MKSCKILFAVFAMFLSGFSFAAGKVSVQTEVVSVDVHGNVNLAIKTPVFTAKGFGASDIVAVNIDGYKFTAPVVKNYSDVNTGETLVRMNGDEISIAINFGNFSKTSGAKVGSKVQISLKEHYGYLNTYQTRMLKKSNERANYSSDEVFANFREVKNGKIAEGKLYRSYNPLENDERGPFALKLAEENKITCIINLVDTEESCSEKCSKASYYKNLFDAKKVFSVKMGSAFDTEDFNNKLKQVLLFIAEHPDEKFLIHGKEGKNRTGYVSALLLALNGASIKEITDDYMLSFENFYGVKKNFQQYELLSKAVPFMFSTMSNGKKVNDKNLQETAFNFLIKSLGLTKEEAEAVCKNLQ